MSLRVVPVIIVFMGTVVSRAASAAPENYALAFNGRDDQVDLFMAPLTKQWTVSAWIKKEGPWVGDEVIVGSGWITNKGWEDYPLCVSNGRLGVYRTGLFARDTPGPGWHHVASRWDGKTTTLFLDGKVVRQKQGGGPICPAFLGSDDGKEFYNGLMDEVQIWDKALPDPLIQQWMTRPVDLTHPLRSHLVAYYRFDDQATDATDYSGDNKADRKIHYKSKGDGNGPSYVRNGNKDFDFGASPMRLVSSSASRTTLGARPGDKEVELLKIKVNVEGHENPLRLSALNLSLSRCSGLEGIENLHVYLLGPNAELDTKQPYGRGNIFPTTKIPLTDENAAVLRPGINYMAVTADLKATAEPGQILHVECESLSLSGQVVKPVHVGSDDGRILLPVKKDPGRLKVLNWNIWHGGIEKGRNVGPGQIMEIIRASDADVVTMVETYGSGPWIAEQLGFHYHETGPGSNLSILSRHPIVETYKSKRSSFQSTGIKVKLEDGKEALVWCVWLRYWPGNYVLTQHLRNYEAVGEWLAGDSMYPVADISEILEKDIKATHDGKMPLIVAGDFNSCSHLDFTQRAATAGLHNGWVVDFPTAKEMLAEGFKDSYREANPDEVTHPGGTWAAIYKWCRDFRIDFIYYKGDGVQVLRSRTIGEHTNAEVLWPGDHAAVITEFEVK